WARARRVVLSGLLGAVACFTSQRALAQEVRAPVGNGEGMDTHLFRPALDSKGFFYVNGSDVLVHNHVSFGLILDWGHNLMRTSGVGGQAGNAPNPVGANGDCTALTPNVPCTPPYAGGVGTGALIDNSFHDTLSASYGLFNRAL